MFQRRIPKVASTVAVVAGCTALAACGGDERDERTRFEQALATLPGEEPVGSGYGWIDIERMRESGVPLAAELEWAREALGPGARDLAGPSADLGSIGLEPLAADAALAVTSNYPSAIRFDGVEPAGVEGTLEAAGAREGEEAGWRTFDLGGESAIPLGTAAEPLGSLAARSATRSGQLVFARSDLARSNMIGDSDRAIDADLVAAGAECIGDPIAARFMLNNHTHVPGLGPDLFAFGVSAPDERPAREVFCAIDDDAARVDAAAEALGGIFEPGARDAVTGEPIRASFVDAVIEDYEGHGHSGVRANLLDAPGTEPGQLFGAFDRGSLVTYVGLPPPPLPDVLRDP